MKTGRIALIAAIAVVAILFGSFIAMNNGDKNVTVADIHDDDDKLDDFDFVISDGTRIDIARDVTLDDDILIDYFGNIEGWKKDPVVKKDSNMVIFSTYIDASSIDYVFVFENILSNSLKASLKDGKPSIELKADEGFAIELYYVDEKGDEDIQQYIFSTYEFMVGKNVDLPVFYGDSMFKVPATQRNADMIAFALGLELSTGVDNPDRALSILRLMRDMGYVNATTNDAYKKSPTITSTDVAIGSKEWNGYNLILVALNGTKYTNEFGANVLLGPDGDHKGFTLACNEALNLLRSFISENGITGKTKILLTGYSRTAAGANLAAAYLSDAIAEGKVAERVGNIELTRDDVYGFSFETPLCGLPTGNHVSPTDARYDNIWYVINCDDPVTYVPPKSYGFVRFGHQVDLPSHDEASRTKMLELVGKYYGSEVVPSFDMSKFVEIGGVKDLKQLWEEFFVKFFNAVGDRKFFNDNIEADFSEFLYSLFAYSGWMQELVGGPSDMISFIVNLDKYSSDEKTFDEYFLPIVEAATSKWGCKEYSDSIVSSMYQMINVIKRYTGGNVYSLIFDPYALSMTTNYKLILMSHLPSMTYCYVVQESNLYN